MNQRLPYLPMTVVVLLLLTGCTARQAAKISPDTPLTAWQVRQVYTEGLAYESLEDYSRAIDRYDIVRSRGSYGYPWAPRAHLRMAEIYHDQLGNPDRAIELYRSYLEQYPESEKHPDILLELGEIYQSQEHYDSAARTYQRLVEEFPVSSVVPEGYYNLGEVRLDQRRYGEAIEALTRLVEDYPETTLADGALFRMGRAYERWGKHDEQLEVYRRLLEDYPESDLREYVLYLTVKTAHARDRSAVARRWAEVYREEYPEGEYLSQVRELEGSVPSS